MTGRRPRRSGPARIRLLEILISAPGRVITRDRLMARPENPEDGGSENALEQIVSRVRRKIAGSGVQIVTVRGVGYMTRDQGARALALFIDDYAQRASDRAFDRPLSASAPSRLGLFV